MAHVQIELSWLYWLNTENDLNPYLYGHFSDFTSGQQTKCSNNGYLQSEWTSESIEVFHLYYWQILTLGRKSKSLLVAVGSHQLNLLHFVWYRSSIQMLKEVLQCNVSFLLHFTHCSSQNFWPVLKLSRAKDLNFDILVLWIISVCFIASIENINFPETSILKDFNSIDSDWLINSSRFQH